MRQKHVTSLWAVLLASFLAMTLQVRASADEKPPSERPEVSLHVYGPGGPAPAMSEAGQVFSKKKGISVEVTTGPTAVWEGQALLDADLIFSGAEHMMTDFVQKDLPDLIDPATIRTLYLRPSAILVRPGGRMSWVAPAALSWSMQCVVILALLQETAAMQKKSGRVTQVMTPGSFGQSGKRRALLPPT